MDLYPPFFRRPWSITLCNISLWSIHQMVVLFQRPYWLEPGGPSGPPPLSLYRAGFGMTPVVEHPGDPPVSRSPPGTTGISTHHLSGLRFPQSDDCGLSVLLIAVDGERSDILPLPPLQVKDHADVFRQVLQIPLVHQAVDLPSPFWWPFTLRYQRCPPPQ